MRPENASRRKLARTRSADQLRSGTRPKVAATRVVEGPLVRDVGRERAGAPGRLQGARDEAGDLAEELPAARAIPLEVEGHVHRGADGVRLDRRDGRLQRDEVLAAASDERAQLAT